METECQGSIPSHRLRKIRDFSEIMRQWGQKFQRKFNQTELGRIIYAGGDDFLGIVYNSQFPDPQLNSIDLDRVFHWLQTPHK
jgi:CRISPR-associated protein Cmr2